MLTPLFLGTLVGAFILVTTDTVPRGGRSWWREAFMVPVLKRHWHD